MFVCFILIGCFHELALSAWIISFQATPRLLHAQSIPWSLHKTGSQYKGKYLCGRVPKNLTLCRIKNGFSLHH